MGMVTGVTVSIDKADLKDIDRLTKNPRCRFRNRSTFIRDLIKRSLPEVKKEIEEDNQGEQY